MNLGFKCRKCKQSQLLKKVQGHAILILIFLPQFRTNVYLFEAVIRLVPTKLWNFLDTRVLYDRCIEN